MVGVRSLVVYVHVWMCLLVGLQAQGTNSLNIKMIYYSPSSIGDHIVISEIDLYTTPYMPLHNVFIPALKERFGVTHILVNNRWDACEECHRQFLKLLSQHDIKLFVSLIGPTNSDAAKGTTALLRVITTELGNYGAGVFEGFHVPVPEHSISDDEWIYYFNYINVIPSLFSSFFPNITVNVELPVMRTTQRLKILTGYSLNQVNTTFWVVSVYGVVSGWYADLLEQLKSNNGNDEPLILNSPFVILFKCSSYDNTKLRSDESQMYNQLQRAYSDTLNQDTPYSIVGYGFYEWSDEWWTSFTSDSGFDIEGCPNSNPFAHTACGLRVKNELLNVEFMGLYALKFLPFQCCLIPRITVASFLAYQVFKQENTTALRTIMDDGICAPFIPPMFSSLFFPASLMILLGPFVLILTCSFLVCLCPIRLKKKKKVQSDATEMKHLSS